MINIDNRNSPFYDVKVTSRLVVSGFAQNNINFASIPVVFSSNNSLIVNPLNIIIS